MPSGWFFLGCPISFILPMKFGKKFLLYVFLSNSPCFSKNNVKNGFKISKKGGVPKARRSPSPQYRSQNQRSFGQIEPFGETICFLLLLLLSSLPSNFFFSFQPVSPRRSHQSTVFVFICFFFFLELNNSVTFLFFVFNSSC